MTRIRAAVCHAFSSPLVIEEVDLRAPRSGEVEVTLDAVAICHSDISFAEGDWGGTLPAVYGHEAAGRITAVGPDVHHASLGDDVIITLIRSCGHCHSCDTGRPVYCETSHDRTAGPLTTIGGGVLEQGLSCGAFAEKVVVDQSQIASIPKTLPKTAAALLACGVVTGVGAAVNAANVRPGETVAVVGAGGVGLNAIQGAKVAGASRIVAVDLSEEKLATAREFGATDGILASEEKPWRKMRQITGRGADAVLVTVGAIAAYEQAARFLAPGGRMILVGMPPSGAKATYEPVILAATGQAMQGTLMGDTVLSRDIPWLIDLHAQGRIKLEELVSRIWPFEEINAAIEDTRAGGARRNVLTFQ